MDDGQKTRRYFLASVSILILLGVVMVYSSSYLFAADTFGKSYYFLLKHVAFIISGLFLALIISRFPFNTWFAKLEFFHAVVIVLMILTFIPGISFATKGASRWINLGLFTIQPGELLKISLPLLTFKLLYRFKMDSLKSNLIKVGLIALPCILLLLQPDFGTFVICTLSVLFILLLSPMKIKYFLAIITAALTGFAFLIILEPYRIQRLTAYLDPWKDPKSSGFQIIQSFLAFANGGIIGVGLGNSHEKLFYLPEAHNDFIFSVLGEELGFVGVVFTISVFMTFIYLGFKLAKSCKTEQSISISSLMIFIVSIQASINFAVALGLLPTKGLNLPFISYGGTSMIVNFIILGLFFSTTSREMEFTKRY
jgi:cell division protein FtsW